jgi:ABC-type antimicrobial peptide transport system permease subunit
MKPVNANKIATIVLWICMTVSIAVFGLFYYDLMVHPDSTDTIETAIVLNWLYLLLFTGISVTLIFSLIHFIFKWKNNPKSIIQPLIAGATLAILFTSGYLLGNGTPLNISGYEGAENTRHWLKLTDMWLYAIYLLLGITFGAVFAGIIRSYFKKTR